MLTDFRMNELNFHVETERIIFLWYLALISDILFLKHKGATYVIDDDGSDG